jgi:hypothetical protein
MKYCVMESINTPVGELVGRNAIYLDYESFDHSAFTLILEGEFSEDCCSELNTNNFIPYLITFHSVTDYRRIPLDEWLYSDSAPETPSSFSSAVIDLPFADDRETTYIFETYDWVFQIRSNCYELKIGADKNES